MRCVRRPAASRAMTERHDHWERIYTSKPETRVSWYQSAADLSLTLITAAVPDRAASIIDVGGGASTLVDGLLDRGRTDVTVLDIAEAGLEQAKERLGARSRRVAWIVADITTWTPPRRWHVWHDRAVFHFLVEPAQQDAYLVALEAATSPGSKVVMGTFALDGPERCSGLPVQRYNATLLARRLGPLYRLTTEAHERHRTPFGTEQNFCWAVLERL